MQRNDEGGRPFGVLQEDVASPLSSGTPAVSFEDLDQLCTGQDGLAVAHAGIGSLRRTTPAPTDRPSSRSSST